jgi:hypothetical protein
VDATSSFSLREVPFGAAGRYVQRFVVQSNGAFYISKWSTDVLFATQTLDDSSSDFGLWASYDLVTAMSFNASSATFSAMSLNHVTAVGFAYTTDSLFGGSLGNPSAPTFDVFSANITSTLAGVPDSGSSIALLTCGIFGMMTFRKFGGR